MKKGKLKEEQMINQTVEQPIPATQADVAQAGVDTNMAPQAQPSVDPMAPPAPGLVPSGWVDPSQLATAVAQATGDVTPAQATIDELVAPSTDGAEPLAAQPQQQEVGELTPEEQEVILEYRKFKAEKMQEEKKDPSVEINMEGKENVDDCENCRVKDVKKSAEDSVLVEHSLEDFSTEEEEELSDAPSDMANDGVDEEDAERVLPSTDDDTLMLDDILVDEDTDPLVDDNTPYEGVGVYDRILDIFDDMPENEMEDFLGDLPDALRNSADFIDSLLSDVDDNDTEEIDDVDDEVEDEKDDSEDEEFGDFDEKVIYPKGSEPNSSEIDNEADLMERKARISSKPKVREGAIVKRNQLIKNRRESQISRKSRLETSRELARKREAISALRNRNTESKVARTSNRRFDEALKGIPSKRIRETSADSWVNNNFLRRYEESAKLDYRELLNSGFLG